MFTQVSHQAPKKTIHSDADLVRILDTHLLLKLEPRERVFDHLGLSLLLQEQRCNLVELRFADGSNLLDGALDLGIERRDEVVHPQLLGG